MAKHLTYITLNRHTLRPVSGDYPPRMNQPVMLVTAWYDQKGQDHGLNPGLLNLFPWPHSCFPDMLASGRMFCEIHVLKPWPCLCLKGERGKEGHRMQAHPFKASLLTSSFRKRLSRRWVSSSVQRSQSMVSQKIHRFFSFLSKEMWDFVWSHCDPYRLLKAE